MSEFGRTFLLVVVTALTMTAVVAAAPRVPPPDFTSEYTIPTPTTPHPRADAWEYLDLAVLVVALVLGSYLALKLRRRPAIFALAVFSIAYFGFWREGCVCPIGAIQNIALATFNTGYAVPLVVLGFFLLPLVAALFFGRTFCGGVCPLGAIQDVVALRPVQVPAWLAGALRLLAYAYLAVAVLLAATGSVFLICKYDPFVAMFRLSGSAGILIAGAGLLLIGVFVARPYCRFLCPYGVLLSWMSRLSWKRVTITPDECIQCRLCETACPHGAIRKPNASAPPRPRHEGRILLAALLVLLPLLTAGGGYVGSLLSPSLTGLNAEVRLAERVAMEEAGLVEGRTDASTAFRAGKQSFDELFARGATLRREFGLGGWIGGGLLGLLVGLKLISLTVRRRRVDYEADRGLCLACGRCFARCPIERKRRRARAGEAQS